MAPELLNSIDAKELRELAQRVLEYQEAKQLSDSGLLRKFPGLGSTTTYKKLLKDQLEELDLEKWLTNYRAAVALIEAMKDEHDEEELFEDLIPVLEIRRSFLEASRKTSLDRFILVEGDTGTGKSQSLKSLLKKFGARIIPIEASVAWGDKPNALLADILKARGIREIPTAQNDRLAAGVNLLRSSRFAVTIDEGHHMGPNCLNMVKTLVNLTPGEFIAGAMKSLWGRLERDAYQEVKQLTGNRLHERIKLSLRETDVKKYLGRRLEGLDGDMGKAVQLVMTHAPTKGNLAFVRGVCKTAREQAERSPMTLDVFTSAVQAEVNKR